jgi:hypothetical protein
MSSRSIGCALTSPISVFLPKAYGYAGG